MNTIQLIVLSGPIVRHLARSSPFMDRSSIIEPFRVPYFRYLKSPIDPEGTQFIGESSISRRWPGALTAISRKASLSRFLEAQSFFVCSSCDENSAPTIQRLLEGIENEMPDEGPYRQFIVNGQYAAVIQLII